jgi:hypothetical protein
MLNLQWVKSQAETWLEFQTFNINSVDADGVYIIWHGGNPGRVVYVGQGDVKSRLQAHRNNTEITKYAKDGTLYVTWASVPAHQKDGVERYLANTWNPLVGDAHPDVTPIAVNSPW